MGTGFPRAASYLKRDVCPKRRIAPARQCSWHTLRLNRQPQILIMSRKSLATRRKPSSRKEHSQLHARDFRRLGLSTDEVRIEVIRSKVTKQARAILAHTGKWIPKRLDDQLSAIVATGYRLIDPRFRTSVKERVFLAYPLEREEEEIPEVASLLEKIDASIAHYDTPGHHTDGLVSQDGSSDSGFICAEVVEFVELATSAAPVVAQENSLECNRELVRLLREQEAEEKAERSVLSKMRKWLTLSSVVLALLSVTAWSLRYRSQRSSVVANTQNESEQAEQSTEQTNTEKTIAEQIAIPAIAEESSQNFADQLAFDPSNAPQAPMAINSLDAIIPPITSSVVLESDLDVATTGEAEPQSLEFNSSPDAVLDGSVAVNPSPEIPEHGESVVAIDGNNEGDRSTIEDQEERFGFVVSKATIRESRNRLTRVLKLLQEMKLDQQSRLDRLTDLLNESPEGSADRLAILEASAKENVKVHGMERGLAVCDRIEQEYPKFGWQARFDLYKSSYLSGKSFEDHGKMAELGLRLSEQALAADEVSMASQLIRLTIGAANRSRDQRILSMALRLQQSIQTARQISRIN